MNEYIDRFGYIELVGLMIPPVIGFVFHKSRLSPEKEAQLTKRKKSLPRSHECILPSFLTNVLCLFFCILTMIEDIRFEIGKKYYLDV